VGAQQENPLVVYWARTLSAAGIGEASLLSERFDPDHFGDGEASFRLGSIILRLVRDRGEDSVEIAPTCAPHEYFRLDDIFVALGWREVKDVLARTSPVPLEEELKEVVRRAEDLEVSLGAKRLPLTREAVREASERRERAFLDELQRLADNCDKV